MRKYEKLLERSKKLIRELRQISEYVKPVSEETAIKSKLDEYARFIEDLETVILSPCVKKCKLIDGTCVGCYRTLDEIQKWTYLNKDEKLLVIDNCNRRKDIHEPKK